MLSEAGKLKAAIKQLDLVVQLLKPEHVRMEEFHTKMAQALQKHESFPKGRVPSCFASLSQTLLLSKHFFARSSTFCAAVRAATSFFFGFLAGLGFSSAAADSMRTRFSDEEDAGRISGGACENDAAQRTRTTIDTRRHDSGCVGKILRGGHILGDVKALT